VEIKKYKSIYIEISVFLIILAVLYYFSQKNYLLFHSFAEIFSIVIAFGIFFIGFNSRKYIDNNFILFLGIAYFFVGFLDFIHTLAYKGMNIFAEGGSNLATQLWISSRYIESMSMIAATFFIKRKLKTFWMFTGYTVVTGLILFLIFHLKIFPVTYTEGTGMTPTKIISEYIIIALILAAIILLFKNRESFNKYIYRLILASFSVTILQEVSFTLYVDAYGYFNLIGHFLKIISFYLLYKVIIEAGLSKPYQLLFNNLIKNRERTQQYVKKLKQTNRDLNAFAYSLSHDTRSLLRKINFRSYLLLEQCNIIDSDCKKFVSDIKKSTDSIENIFEGLLKLYNITKRKIRIEKIDFSRSARIIAKYLKELEKDRKITIKIQDNVYLNFDQDLLNILLMNLIDNAIKYTRKRQAAKIEIGKLDDNGKLLYYIKDNGEGMPEYFSGKEYKYEPFVRKNIKTEGYGVGLAIVKRIVDIFNGKIWYDSSREGTTFYFRFKESD
jgi:signal transduction histidine kinase